MRQKVLVRAQHQLWLVCGRWEAIMRLLLGHGHFAGPERAELLLPLSHADIRHRQAEVLG